MIDFRNSRLMRKIMIFLYNNWLTNKIETIYITEISKKTDTTYSNTFKIINELQNQNYIKTEKKGRIRYVLLTDKGKEIGKKLIQLKDVII